MALLFSKHSNYALCKINGNKEIINQIILKKKLDLPGAQKLVIRNL